MDIQQIVVEHKELVARIAQVIGRRVLPYIGCIEKEDLVQDGFVGLIDAVKKYDASRGVSFTAYAQYRIRGEIYDNLRRLSSSYRHISQTKKQYGAAVEFLEAKFNRKPTRNEVAKYLKWSIEKLVGVEQYNIRLCSLEDKLGRDEDGNVLTYGDIIEDSHTLRDQIIAKIFARQYLEKLPLRLQKIIIFRYFAGEPLSKISRRMGVSEGRICQLHSKAIEMLRVAISGEE